MNFAILTCSEHFVQFAINEIRRYHPTVKYIRPLAAKHHLISYDGHFSKLTAPWHHKLSIYLHHCFPLEHQILIDNDLTVFWQRIKRIVEPFDRVDIRVISSDTYFAHEIRQAASMTKNHKCRHPKVMSILVVDHIAYLGVSRARHNLSPYPFGKRYFKESVPNRAGLKLLESLDSFSIRLRKHSNALDLGAAPGAWTGVLRRRDLTVTSVAPDEMYKALQRDKRVHHYHMTAEEYVHQCDQTFDLIVNDMKMDAQDSARLMRVYSKHLRDNGIAIMTLKLRMRRTMRVLDHSYRLLRQRYKIIQVRQLTSNKKEVTLFLRKKH